MSQVGYKLRAGAHPSVGPISFSGILPGSWSADPVAAYDLGMTEGEIDKVIAEHDLPLDKVKNVEPTRAEGAMVSGADIKPAAPEPHPDAVAEAKSATPEELKGKTRDELNALATAAGVPEPTSFSSKDELISAIGAGS